MNGSASSRIERFDADRLNVPATILTLEHGRMRRVTVEPQWTEMATLPDGAQALRLSDEGRAALCAFARNMRRFSEE